MGWYVTQISSLEPRLQRRDEQLVSHHMSTTQTTAAGLRALPETAGSFAAAQAAGRCYTTPRGSLPQVVAPLLSHARAAAQTACAADALILQDGSPLSYPRHTSKRDRLQRSHRGAVGDELQAALLVRDPPGAPLARVSEGGRAAEGLHRSRRPLPERARPHLEALSRTMGYVAGLGLAPPTVHSGDRAAAAVLPRRRWQRQGRAFVIRADELRPVCSGGQAPPLRAVLARLAAEVRFSRAVKVKGQPAQQYVAETEVTLYRAAKIRQRRHGVLARQVVPGPPLPRRLVVSQVHTAAGEGVAQGGGGPTCPRGSRPPPWRCGLTGGGRLRRSSSCSSAPGSISSRGSKEARPQLPNAC